MDELRTHPSETRLEPDLEPKSQCILCGHGGYTFVVGVCWSKHINAAFSQHGRINNVFDAPSSIALSRSPRSPSRVWCELTCANEQKLKWKVASSRVGPYHMV